MVFVLDRQQKPLMPCSEKRARLLLERGRARIHRMAPFTIRLIDRDQADLVLQPIRLKLDPGSKTTGVALILDGNAGPKAIWLGEIAHKPNIARRLAARAHLRRGRRARHTRYRPARSLNRRKPKGWLPPSLVARVDQTLHAVRKFTQAAPVSAISVEHVRFDTQKLQDPEITSVAYQQGSLLGYEIREYLLDKWQRQCAYCDAIDVALEVEHIHPQARGGSDRLSNLTIACHACNQAKDTMAIETFLANDPGRRQRFRKHATAWAHGDPDLQKQRATWETHRLTRIHQQRRTPLRDAAAMNATRWRLYGQLQTLGLSVEGGSGGRTKMQRVQRALPKEHYYDALCVGKSTPNGPFTALPAYVQIWSAKGRGNRQRCRTDGYGFPIRYLSGQKQHFGFQTGDLVRADIPRGKYAGTWTGRATVKASGQILITTATDVHPTTHYRHCRILQRGDGWHYTQKPTNMTREDAASSPA